MFIIECLDSEYKECFINNIVNNTDEKILFFDKEKIIVISNNYIEFVKQKIIFFQMLLENNTVDDPKPIIIPIKNINYYDMIFVINFLKIDNDIVNNYFKDLNKNDQYVSSTNTKNMPKILVDFFDEYTVINTTLDLLCDASQYKDVELDYNKLKYLEKITQIADFLQYDLLCDASQYKYADNIRIIDKTLLKTFMKEKLINSDEINKINDYINNNNNLDNIAQFLEEITIIDYKTLQKLIINKCNKDIIIEEILNGVLYDLDQLY
jgi:hypothetical protein